MNFNKFFIIILLAVFFILPNNTFALQVYNNVNIDYRFFIDEDESDTGNLHFRLYDKSGTLNFESKYDFDSKYYYFEYDEINFDVGNMNWSWNYGDDYYLSNFYESYFPKYIPYVDYFDTHEDICYYDFLSSCNYDIWEYGWYWSFYSYVPIILEEMNTGKKSIHFVSIFVRKESNDTYFTGLFFVNNTLKWKKELNYFRDRFLDNLEFMRKTVLDYSDELWEELNNGPIASNEIYSDMISSGKYENKSLSSGNYNVSEETLEDYANSLPLLSFKKENNSNNDVNKEDNNINILDVITNPQTWNNGLVILIISMMIIISCSYLFIRKKKV